MLYVSFILCLAVYFVLYLDLEYVNKDHNNSIECRPNFPRQSRILLNTLNFYYLL